ncbi:MAG: hypothetical protein Q9169_007792 [Polycauliona sp. 2 TL-2023]
MPHPVTLESESTASIFESHHLDLLLTTLPVPNRSARDAEIFTLRNALCCLPHRYPVVFNKQRRRDLEAELNRFRTNNPSYVAAWIAEGSESEDNVKAFKTFRDAYEALQGTWDEMLKDLKVVDTAAQLEDYSRFPSSSLDYICVGIRMAMPKADLARALERWYSTDEWPNKLRPFTEDNVELICDYLCSSGWTIYDQYVLTDTEGYKEKREEMLKELVDEASVSWIDSET